MINIRLIKKYCKDDISLIENYDKAVTDKTQTWHCHHRLETELNVSRQQLIDIGRYFNVPTNELIFLTSKEHHKIHFKDKKKGHLSEETKRKISENSGAKRAEVRKKISDKLKNRVFTEEHRQHMREASRRRWHPELFK